MTTTSQTMRSVVLTRHAADGQWAGALEWRAALPRPSPRATQVLVRVVAHALNPVDVKSARGFMRLVHGDDALPRVPGLDVAGVVVAAGGSVTNVRVGDAVFCGLSSALKGGAAEFAVAEAAHVAVKPPALSFAAAAALPVAATTSLACLHLCRVAPGARLLIRGASGGCGLFAIQMARRLGAAEVVCVSSATELCTRLGATEVMPHKNSDWVAALCGRDFDAMYDCVGGREGWLSAKQLVKSRGHYVTIVPDAHGAFTAGVVLGAVGSLLWRKAGSLFGGPTYSLYLGSTPTTAELDEVARMVTDDNLEVVFDPSSPFPFSEDGIVAMYTKQQSATAKGKLYVHIQDP